MDLLGAREGDGSRGGAQVPAREYLFTCERSAERAVSPRGAMMLRAVAYHGERLAAPSDEESEDDGSVRRQSLPTSPMGALGRGFSGPGCCCRTRRTRPTRWRRRRRGRWFSQSG